MRKVIRRRDAQRVAEHVHGYLRQTNRAMVDVIATWEHGTAPTGQGLLHSILHTEILEQAARYEKAFSLRDMVGVNLVLQETLIAYGVQEYDHTAAMYTQRALLKRLQSFRGVDGQEFSPLAIVRRARILTTPLKYHTNEEVHTGSGGARLLQVVSPGLWNDLIERLTRVVHNVYVATHDEATRMSPLYKVLTKYTILYGMALVHEVIESSDLDPSTPLAWSRPLLDQQIMERHREQLTLLRQALYTGGGVYIPSSVSSRSHWNMLWTALSAVEQETSYESAQ